MLILIVQPRLTPRQFVAALAQDRVEWYDAKASQSCDGSSEANRQTRDGVVHADDHHAARPRKAGHFGEGGSWICRVMQDP